MDKILLTSLMLIMIFHGQNVLGSSETSCSTSKVRLVSPLGQIAKSLGIVQVCGVDGSKNQWNFICADDLVPLTDDGVSHAVCKQLGYVGATKDGNRLRYLVTDAIIEALSPATMAVQNIKCPIVGDYYADGELVLMRCEHSDTLIDVRNCTYVLGVQCNKTLSTQTPYNGQVWLDDIDGSSLTPNPLLLYLNTEGSLERGHVCLPKQISSNKTLQLIADTVCRQLGYTNSPTFYIDSGSYSGEIHWQINGEINCGCTCPSLPCFDHCINVDSISKQNDCDQDFVTIEIACEYNQAIAGEYGAGSRGMCMLHAPSNNDNGPVAASIILALAFIIAVVIIISLSIVILRKGDYKLVS